MSEKGDCYEASSTPQECPPKPLPPYSTESYTRKVCIAGVIAASTISILAIALAVPTFVAEGAFRNNETPVIRSKVRKEVASLLLNICITICTELLGYIHSVSLRWALYHEGRLSFNSNLRLFTSSRQCRANAWYTNTLWALLLTISYSSASQVLQPTGDMGPRPWSKPGYEVESYSRNDQAMAILGAAMLLQCILAAWCMAPSQSRRILSYNSSPLNTTLALLHHDLARPECHRPAVPRPHQTPVIKAVREVRWITVFLWCLTPLIAIWGAAMWLVSVERYGVPDLSFDPQIEDGTCPVGRHGYDSLVGLASITAMQLVYTLALHAAEQVVNLSRDEAVWRRAAAAGGLLAPGDGCPGGAAIAGAPVSQKSTTAALTAWQTPLVLLFKPTSHWLFGISAVTLSDGYLAFHPLPIFSLAGMAVLLAGFVTFISLRKPSGPQPAAWGNVLRLAEYVDDWGVGAGGSLFWGDKGPVEDCDGIRMAGTSGVRNDLYAIEMCGVRYQGVGP